MTNKTSVNVEELQAARGKIGVLELNSPKTLNSLTLEMVEILSAQLSKWEQEEDLSLVILKGAGEKAFCAGGDVQKLYESAISKPGGPCEYGETFFLKEYILDHQIHSYPKPILCVGTGIVMGGGLGLMAGASHRIASDTTRIAMPEITIGLYPDVGGTYFLNKMPYSLGYFFGLTGASINGHDALICQLADHFIPQDQLDALMKTINETNWETSDEVGNISNHQKLDEILSEKAILPKNLRKHLASNIQNNLSTLESICQETSLAEIINAIANVDTEDKWLTKAAAALNAGCPLSSVLIYEQLKRHKISSLRDIFLAEYQLSTNVIRYPDFSEGVRALLIDKDNNPKWQFEHFSDVPSSLINTMFSQPWDQNPLSLALPESS